MKAITHGWEALTRRERAVLPLIAQGLMDKEIVRIIGVTEKTMQVYVRGLKDKLGVESRVSLALLWRNRHGDPLAILRRLMLENTARDALIAWLAYKGDDQAACVYCGSYGGDINPFDLGTDVDLNAWPHAETCPVKEGLQLLAKIGRG